jgi:DNA-binding NarL/FixJ family response regulator
MLIRVLVVDDQDPFRQAAAEVIAATETFALVGTAASGEESLDAVGQLALTWF